jgi:predicted ATP-dependent protease
LRDLAVEADFRASIAGHAIIAREDVDQAIEEQRRRANRLEQRARESVRRGLALIDTSGVREGQINGLSVATIGGYSFGTAARITCRVRPGAGKIVDIEREVELGGPIHSKGVLILSGFLAGRYALEEPMSLFASIVFEQSYGGVEGDSASAAELCALISAISGVPLRQDCAMTGSVNQHGQIQPIGGVNEKIEGFFEICRDRGLTGTQTVLIPASNVQHLMLRADVVEACARGEFSVIAIETIDQALETLTGREAGAREADGRFPKESVNGLVEERLAAFAKARRRSDDPSAGKAES